MTAAQRSVADRLLTEKGQAITITRRAAGTYDTTTGTAAITTSTQAGKGVILPLSAFRKSGGNIVEGDQQLLLSALKSDGSILTEPKVDDTVTDANADVWSLIAVEALSPAGLDVLYDCIVRRQA